MMFAIPSSAGDPGRCHQARELFRSGLVLKIHDPEAGDNSQVQPARPLPQHPEPVSFPESSA